MGPWNKWRGPALRGEDAVYAAKARSRSLDGEHGVVRSPKSKIPPLPFRRQGFSKKANSWKASDLKHSSEDSTTSPMRGHIFAEIPKTARTLVSPRPSLQLPLDDAQDRR
jgi:hypothetical protein